MAKRSLSITTFTPTAFGDAAALTDNNYAGIIQGGSATQRVNVIEVMETGQASASAPTIMLLSRDSTVGVTVIAGSTTDQPLDGSVAAFAAPAQVGNSASTDPQRSASGHILNLSFNAFGGIVRWVAAPGEEIVVVGNTQPLGEVSLSAFTGGSPGLMGTHIIYEPI